MKKMFIVSLLSLSAFVFQPLWAETVPESLPYRVLENGAVLIYQGNQFAAYIAPEVFTTGWSYHTFSKPTDKKQKGLSGFCDLGGESYVSLKAKVKIISNGLHFHYTLIPNQTVAVNCVRTVLDLTYNDWKGVPYQLGKDQGQTPASLKDEGVLSKMDGQPLLLGPSPALNGLILRLNPGSGHITLQDNRKWSPNLIPFITHGEPSDQVWVWKAGEKKVFDFTVIFNRPIHEWIAKNPKKKIQCNKKEISFINSQAGVTIYGTLTLPKGTGPFPVVEIIGGSGPDPRNNYFDTVTETLVSRGVGDLRYDKRGTGKSTGNYLASTSQDFANDAACGVEYLKNLKKIDPQKIGLLGHSEGGLIAPMVEVHTKDVAFMVLMAAPAVTGERLYIGQQESIYKNQGLDEKTRDVRLKILKRLLEMMKQGKADASVALKVKDIVKDEMGSLGKNNPMALMDAQNYWREKVGAFLKTPWNRFFVLYDPRIDLRQVTCPILALAGDQDAVVPPKENLFAIESALKEARNSDYTVKLLPGIGHGFGVPGGSIDPSQIIDPGVLTIIGDWVERHTK